MVGRYKYFLLIWIVMAELLFTLHGTSWGLISPL